MTTLCSRTKRLPFACYGTVAYILLWCVVAYVHSETSKAELCLLFSLEIEALFPKFIRVVQCNNYCCSRFFMNYDVHRMTYRFFIPNRSVIPHVSVTSGKFSRLVLLKWAQIAPRRHGVWSCASSARSFESLSRKCYPILREDWWAWRPL